MCYSLDITELYSQNYIVKYKQFPLRNKLVNVACLVNVAWTSHAATSLKIVFPYPCLTLLPVAVKSHPSIPCPGPLAPCACARRVSLARNDAQHLHKAWDFLPHHLLIFLRGDNIPRYLLLYSFNVVAVNCLLSFPQAELRHVVALLTCLVELNLRNTLFAFCLYSTFSPSSSIASLLQSIAFIIRVTRRLRLYR